MLNTYEKPWYPLHMEHTLQKTLEKELKGDISVDINEREKYSRDTSVFERTPSLVVYPKDSEDVATLVRIAKDAKENDKSISVTARSAGTCMTGGPLTDSIVAVFPKYMNRVHEVSDEGYAIAEPGVYYRDFEKETLKKGYLLPSYPASREIAALGGIINNNSGGEQTLEYGKTERYIEELEVVLADGSLITLRELSMEALEEKKLLDTHEGHIYREMASLIEHNNTHIEESTPRVSKNSAGYALWSVWDRTKNTFNLAKLIVGAQGTLALVTKAKISLIRPQKHRAMLVVFLNDFNTLPDTVLSILAYNPESFESYDDHTFRLAVRFLPQIVRNLGFRKMLSLGLSFLPEVGMVISGGVPKLVLMAEFSEDTPHEARRMAEQAKKALQHLPVRARVTRNQNESDKYWTIRRESFSLLRKNLKGYTAAPFIDDIVVDPKVYPEFLPKLYALLAEYDLIYTIAGHVGNGNFHIIPLMDMKKENTREIILELSTRTYDLVREYHGSITGEHNDGIIRTPYLDMMFDEKMLRLFEKTKQIWDPTNLFNPGKKVGGTKDDICRSMIH